MILLRSADAVQGSFYDLWFTVSLFLPKILAAIVIFIIGWIIASIIYRLVHGLCSSLKINDILRNAGIEDAATEAGVSFDPSKFLSSLAMWFVILWFLIASLEVVGLETVTVFIKQVALLYVPQVMVASFIIILAAVIAEAVKSFVSGSARAAGIHSANLAGTIAKWAVWIFGIIAALSQLGIGTVFIQTLYTGVVIALAIAFGLAFGLGGKIAAADVIKKVRAEIKHELE